VTTIPETPPVLKSSTWNPDDRLAALREAIESYRAADGHGRMDEARRQADYIVRLVDIFDLALSKGRALPRAWSEPDTPDGVDTTTGEIVARWSPDWHAGLMANGVLKEAP
jgi:hypothetical protein